MIGGAVDLAPSSLGIRGSGAFAAIMWTSLSRPQQLLGGDREMVIMAGLGAAMMAVSVMTFFSFLIAIVGFWVVVGVLARIGKSIP